MVCPSRQIPRRSGERDLKVLGFWVAHDKA
jgi:hypothetical protein